MDSRPALLTVVASIAVITLVAFLTIDMTTRLEDEQKKKNESTPLDPDKTDPDKGEKKDDPVTDNNEEIPSFDTKPVDGEPGLPMTDKAAEAAGHLTMPRGGYTFTVKLPGTEETVDGVAVPGMIIMQRGLIEFFGTGEGSGKDHETIVRLNCDIQELDMALRMSEFERGPVPDRLGDAKTIQGSRVLAFVRWKDGDRMITRRAEDLIIDVKKRETMPRVGWVYVGNWMEVDDPMNPGESKQRILAASVSRLLLSTWRNMTALLDNPLPTANDPDTYFANHDVLPEPGTEILVYFRAPTKAERDAILKLEREYGDD